ncbi:cupin domain-containing protein [Agrobacterium arsenijevicii]|uniref:Cupin n=1 Tax=Agrobacterium arsenijevicii TaxID=1585697 RepID=A0ABR5DDX5_9HYPH|nr:cupin [Agrobacterium arsenijevicii]
MPFKMMFAAAATMAIRTVPILPASLRRAKNEGVVSASCTDLRLQPAPINPDWIISGDPQARAADHSRSGDRASSTAMWDCTAGEFRWFFGWDETVYILEGEVHVTAEDGSVSILRVGDVAYFRAGTWATWRVDDYVRKVAFMRRPFPTALALAYRVKNKLFAGRSYKLAA